MKRREPIFEVPAEQAAGATTRGLLQAAIYKATARQTLGVLSGHAV
jgi:hypothetical protein